MYLAAQNVKGPCRSKVTTGAFRDSGAGAGASAGAGLGD